VAEAVLLRIDRRRCPRGLEVAEVRLAERLDPSASTSVVNTTVSGWHGAEQHDHHDGEDRHATSDVRFT
jgi:hypothetical protein